MENTKNEPDRTIQLARLGASQDWGATFWCDHCEKHHHVVAFKLRKNYRAMVYEGADTKPKLLGDYKAIAGSPDDKLLDDLEEQFHTEDFDDDDED